jgi:hypothetical protein
MMKFIRYWLPAIIVVAGVVLIVVTPDKAEAAMYFVSAGLSVWLLNWLFRLGLSGDRERDAEDRARDFFDEHGHWPDETPRT